MIVEMEIFKLGDDVGVIAKISLFAKLSRENNKWVVHEFGFLNNQKWQDFFDLKTVIDGEKKFFTTKGSAMAIINRKRTLLQL